MDAATMSHGLLEWVATFPLSKPHSSSEELSDGTGIAECLSQIDPVFFSESWLSCLVQDCEGNAMLKNNNLKKILKRMVEYFDEVHSIQLSEFPQPDVSAIAKAESDLDLARMLQIMLGIAIHCEKKQVYVQAIRNMDESVQMVVMAALQELLNGCQQKSKSVSGEEFSEIEEKLRDTVSRLSAMEQERDEIAQQNYELKQQVQERMEEILELREEARSKVFEPGTPLDVRRELHHRELDQVRREKMEEEALKEEYRMRAEESEQHIQELLEKTREQAAQLEGLSMLEDQLEEMKHLEEKVHRYEQQISVYKVKLEDVHDLKKQVRSLEEKNAVYMQQNLDLEEELRRSSSVKVQLNTHKQRIQELQRSLLESQTQQQMLAHEADMKDQQIKGLQEEMMHTKDQLKSGHVSRPEIVAAEPGIKLEAEQVDFSGVGLLTEAYTPDLREKMLRLEKENEIMRRRLESPSGESGHEVVELQTALEMAQLKIVELESMLATRSVPAGNASELKMAQEVAAQRIKDLEADVESKAVEIEKLKKYLNKAKKIIEGFGPKPNLAEETGEIHTLKQQLGDKEAYIQRLEKKLEEGRELKEREEKLVITAWYDIGMQLMQKNSEQRLASSMPFLAQQRQALLSRKEVTSPRSPPLRS